MYEKKIKRILDVIVSSVGIILLFPLLLIIMLLIKIDSDGPALFKQKRVGLHKSHFEILKFRTMLTSSPAECSTKQLTQPDLHITRVGKFLRKTSLDELPQIFNILFGHMSIVGPRPVILNEEDLIIERDQYGANSVKPGLTGLAQISGRDRLDHLEKARLDGLYANNISLSLDVQCFFRTISYVLKRKDIVDGSLIPND